MDDFSIPNSTNVYGIPASPANFIQPGKRPLSSMVPTVITDANGNVKLILGGAGGSRITTAVAYGIIRHLYLNETLTNAVAAKRLHHQLAPMVAEYEEGTEPEIVAGLVSREHEVRLVPQDSGFAALTGISYNTDNDEIEAVFDPRRGGSNAITKL